MKKIIKQGNDKLELFFYNNYPFVNCSFSNKKNIVTIGIGGNVGDTKRIFDKLFLSLKEDSRFFIQKTSPILKNPPFGFLEQDDFYNALIVLKTDLSPFCCLKNFQRYEKRFKRKRSFKDAPRTLDIDIIFFNDIKIDTKTLTIPHKGYTKRESVQIPLKFILSA